MERINKVYSGRTSVYYAGRRTLPPGSPPAIAVGKRITAFRKTYGFSLPFGRNKYTTYP